MNIEISGAEYRHLIETSTKFDILVSMILEKATLSVDKNGFWYSDRIEYLKLIAPEEYLDRLNELKEEHDD